MTKEAAATALNRGMIVSANSSPQASENRPAMKGPKASPNKFWNRASREHPVARTPGWTTSMTIAAVGPTVQVIMKPPSVMSANCGPAVSERPNRGVPNASIRTIKVAMHNKDNAANLARGRDVPTRSTDGPTHDAADCARQHDNRSPDPRPAPARCHMSD